jgi:hypothetical protein
MASEGVTTTEGGRENLTGNMHWIDSLIFLKQIELASKQIELSKLRSENEQISSRLREKQRKLSQIEKKQLIPHYSKNTIKMRSVRVGA